MSPGQQVLDLIFSSISTLLSGFVSAILNSVFSSFIQPIFDAIALSLGVPMP